MKINTYKMRLNENRISMLVKEETHEYEADNVDRSEIAVDMMQMIYDIGNLPEEYIFMIALGGGRDVKGVFEISHGILNASLIHPREVFIRAILAGASSIILVHNHPSGQLGISEDDNNVTTRIRLAGELLGINLVDHLVIAGDAFTSII